MLVNQDSVLCHGVSKRYPSGKCVSCPIYNLASIRIGHQRFDTTTTATGFIGDENDDEDHDHDDDCHDDYDHRVTNHD